MQVAYTIGVAHPVSLLVETFGTEKADPEKIADAVRELFDLRPAAIARDLDLRRPIYRRRRPTATSDGRTRSSHGRPPHGWTTCGAALGL